MEVWDDIVTVVKFWMSLPKFKQPSSDNKSYTRLKEAITDPLIKTKFNSSFSVTFQMDNLMVPFIAKSIEEMIRNYASSFLFRETLTNANSCLRLSEIEDRC